nr:protein terminal ear1 homolog [Tanacetum cinerariifolium]
MSSDEMLKEAVQEEMLVKFLGDHCKTQNEMVGNDEKSAFDFVYLPIDF